MTETSYPFDGAQIATELEWARMAGRWGISGVHANTPGSPNLRVTGSSTANVTVGAGRAYVNGFFYRNDSNLSVGVSANPGGAARVDLVVLRCDMNANGVTAQYKTGGTIAPDLAQDEEGVYEVPLAQCTVAAGSSVVTAANVVDKRWFTGKTVCPSVPGSRRPATEGLLIVEGNDIYLGDGTNWNWVATAGSRDTDTYSPVWTAGSTTIDWGPSAKNVGRYKRIGPRQVWLGIELAPTGNPPAYPDPISVTLPIPCSSSMRQLFNAHLNSGGANDEGFRNGIAMTFPTESTTQIARVRINTAAGTTENWLTNSPINFRSGDIMTISGVYETA